MLPINPIIQPTNGPALRKSMNGKPVLFREGKSVLTLKSHEFHEKMLCDALVFNPGDACAYSCEFCYVGAAMWKLDGPVVHAHNAVAKTSLKFPEVVIRRKNVIGILKGQLLETSGARKYPDPADNRVVFGSTLVDVAANMVLLKETAEACNLIFEHTGWQVRLLSKSSLLHKLVEENLVASKYHQRLILGFSTGTLDDGLARVIETGTALVSKRLESLEWLQNAGIRTFGMICPSLPQKDYKLFSDQICRAINVGKCEHVWAEVINLRGESFNRTIASLQKAGFQDEAQSLVDASNSKDSNWEDYARQTFLAHAKNVPSNKLRFLQYVSGKSAPWWKEQRKFGAVLLGKHAKDLRITSLDEPSATPFVSKPIAIKHGSLPVYALSSSDLQYKSDREEIVSKYLSASIAAAKALHEIYTFRDGALWKQEHRSFAGYCRIRWGYGRAHAYRLVNSGNFLMELEKQSTNGDCIPKNEGQIRPVLAFPAAERVEVWKHVTSGLKDGELTAEIVTDRLRDRADFHQTKLEGRGTYPSSKAAGVASALSRLTKLANAHPKAKKINRLLVQIGKLLGS
mgnify:CR=1 FL=1